MIIWLSKQGMQPEGAKDMQERLLNSAWCLLLIWYFLLAATLAMQNAGIDLSISGIYLTQKHKNWGKRFEGHKNANANQK